jgi:hypothetical protein
MNKEIAYELGRANDQGAHDPILRRACLRAERFGLGASSALIVPWDNFFVY